jgi:O-antigen ligase/polysaccharide polymerase Wzy-like membrane protein
MNLFSRKTAFWPSIVSVVLCFIFYLKNYSDNSASLSHSIFGSSALQSFSIFAFLSILLVVFFVCLRGSFVSAISWLLIVICYEPVVQTVIPEIGRSFSIYAITFFNLILFIRCRRFSLPALMFFCVGMSFYLHVLVELILMKGLSFDILSVDIYRSGLNQGTMYFGAALMTAFMQGWHPDRESFLTIVRVGVLLLMGLIIISIIFAYKMSLFDSYKFFLLDMRLSAVNNLSSNSFAALCCLTILSFLVLFLNNDWNWIYTIGLIISIIALILSKSRAQIFIMILLLPVGIILLGKKWGPALYFSLLMYIFIGALLIYITNYFHFVYTFFEFRERKISTLTGRLETWKIVFEIIKNNLFWGTNYVKYYSIISKNTLFKTPHNPFLNVMVFNGIFVGFGFIFAHIYMIWLVVKRWKNVDYGYRMILFTGIVCIILHQSFDLWYFMYFWFLSWSVIKFKKS